MAIDHKFCTYKILQEVEGNRTVALHGQLEIGTAAEILKSLSSDLKKIKIASLSIDLSDVSYIDDYGAMVLNEIQHLFNIPDDQFQIRNASDSLREVISSVSQILKQKTEFDTPSKKKGIIIPLGEKTIETILSLKFFVSFIGSVFIAATQMIKKPKSLRFQDVILYMKTTGVDALPVVALISLLLGLIMAFMSSLQLKQFGANIYVASLVSLAMVSELGPIMTAIVVAGRSGSAYAAEISAMKISEEIDALYTMGFDPVMFLVVPRLIAAVIVIPILTIFADIFAIAGGLFIGITMLNLTASTYITQTIHALSLFEFFWGLSKSAVFSLLISGIGCLRGFQAKGGASSVGHSATSAVVTSIFFIILVDSLFAVIRSYWG